jgi:tetratricopeptide (TPR) repeat protein
MHPSLLAITAYARSGALDYAWRMFRDAGLDRINDDPAVLSVMGRLLKDRALRETGKERRLLYREAAGAYNRAGDIGRETYPLINAATLSLLAGQQEQARMLAGKVLALNQVDQDELETPYYRAATRAEALLLLGDIPRAKAAFAEAISLAPRAFEDHASTLRQFGLILDELGEDRTWLDLYRPPRSLHYAGHMGLAAESNGTEHLIRDFLQKERIGFGFGALAAGADILIAEALLEQGAELHLLLPSTAASFRETSVARPGNDWATRFDRIIENAYSVRSVVTETDPSSHLALQLAAEVSMGQAVMQADVLMTEAVQLVILDRSASPEGPPGSSSWVCSTWERAVRRQHVLTAPRIPTEADAYAHEFPGASSDCLAAMLRIEWPEADTNILSREILPRLVKVFANGPKAMIAPRWTGEALFAAFATPVQAAQISLSAVAALAGVADICISGHYGIAARMDDPFGQMPCLLGHAAAMPRQIVLSTPPGAIHVTEDFATALHAGPSQGCPRTEYVGDLPLSGCGDPVRLFAITRNG